MRNDYHMHLEHGAYEEDYAEGFFTAAKERHLDEIGFSEHSHTFPEFQALYEEDLILDDSPIGEFQRKWLRKNKFKYRLEDYFAFIEKLRQKHHVKAGIEVCNFQNQEAVKSLLESYPFDYVIGSVHFLHGWGFDASALKFHWHEVDLHEVYETYTQEVEKLCASRLYDVLGHPFNIRLFRYFPDFDVTPYLERVAQALRAAHMLVDVNTGTLYRYPVQEISPYPAFMKLAARYGLTCILTSDAHEPQDAGAYHDEALHYARRFGFTQTVCFTQRKRELMPLS